LRGAGDTRVPVLFTWLGFFLVRIPLAYLLTQQRFGLGLLGAWLAMFADLVVRGVFFLLRFAGGRGEAMKVGGRGLPPPPRRGRRGPPDNANDTPPPHPPPPGGGERGSEAHAPDDALTGVAAGGGQQAVGAEAHRAGPAPPPGERPRHPPRLGVEQPHRRVVV